MDCPAPILPPDEYVDLPVFFDQVGIRTKNAHRFEMEQLTAILLNDGERQLCVGYKDVGADEFWARGNLPARPFMPSMLLCEVAAQLCCFYVQTHGPEEQRVLAFAGLEGVEFGAPVTPGQRIFAVGKVLRFRPGVMIRWQFQLFVEQQMVCYGTLKGVPLPAEWLAARVNKTAG